MDRGDVVLIGASAGGVEAVSHVLELLPSGFRAPIAITLHRGAHEHYQDGSGTLEQVLSESTSISCVAACDGQTLRPGVAYVAPPDRHLLIARGGVIEVYNGPKEHHTRPAIDPMFRSAAIAFGPHAIGVLLTGNLCDGVAGLREIKRRAGRTIVQNPNNARFPSLPTAAIAAGCADHILSIPQIAKFLEAAVSATH